MMDPQAQSTSDQIRKSSGSLVDAELRPENRLADVASKYRELFDFAPEAYLTTDLYGTIRDANIAAGRLLGAEPKYLVGKALHSFFEESARKQFPHQLDHLCDRDSLDWEVWLEPRN